MFTVAWLGVLAKMALVMVKFTDVVYIVDGSIRG